MKEITTLEEEIIYLERYLLSLYRSAFEQHIPSVYGNCESPLPTNIVIRSRATADQSYLSREPNLCKGDSDRNNHRSPIHGLAGPDNRSHATTPRFSSERVSIT